MQAVLLGNGAPIAASTRGKRATLRGDLIATRWQIPVQWTSAFDRYAIRAVEIRITLVTQAAPEGCWCYFTRDLGELPT